MTEYTLHNVENAEGETKDVLEMAQKGYGFVPNLIAGLAEAPSAARGYMALGQEVMKTSFAPTERHVVWFAVNYFNNCHYCMPAHTAVAKGEQIDDDVIEAARNGGGYQDTRLQTLHDYVTAMVDKRGEIDDATADAFFAAGFTKQNALEVVLIIAHKTISNYANHLMLTPVDDRLAPFAWEKG